MTDPPTGALRLVIGCDDAGLAYKEILKQDLLAHPRVASVQDLGVFREDPTDATYPAIGIKAGELIATGAADRGVLICGTGIGMAIAANKVAGVRATVAHDSFSVERSILSNNCQILAMGERVVGLQLARRLAAEWLEYTFDPSSGSNSKVDLISEYERH